ncbi:MAG: nucleotidyltransferase family protein, partial [bacterium]|nr:nucleotidyltransferase family protein [bacterium]
MEPEHRDIIFELVKKELNWDYITRCAKSEKILPLLHHNLTQMEISDRMPAEIRAEFERLYRAITGKNIILYQELQKILHLFEVEKCPTIVLKGAAYIETLYHNLCLRAMGDIDLLLREPDLERARSLLLNSGYQQRDGWLQHPRIDNHHLVPFYHKKQKTLVELHWNISMYPSLFPVNMDDVWQSALPQKFHHANAMILSPEDMILHQCCHIFITHSGDFSLKNLCDLAEMVLTFNQKINWQRLLDCCQAYRTSSLLYSALKLMEKIYQLSPPTFALATLNKRCSTKQVEWLENIEIASYIQDKKLKNITPLARLFWIDQQRDRLFYLLGSLIPPLHLMRKRYHLSKNSLRLFWYYLLRPVQILYEYGRDLFNLPLSAPPVGL